MNLSACRIPSNPVLLMVAVSIAVAVVASRLTVSSTCKLHQLHIPQPSHLLAQPHECQVTTEYLPSELEQQWLQNVADWQKAFCSRMEPLSNFTARWLHTLEAHAQLQQQSLDGAKSPAQVLAERSKLDSRVFSRFKTQYKCSAGEPTELVTWVEPLSHGLRHPNALCKRGADVMDRGYLLLTHQREVEAAREMYGGCVNRTCQAIYIDLGATTLVPGTEEAGQGWFFNAYKQNGITFDRFLLWEAVPKPPADIFKHVPKADLHKYQYYNIPVTSNIADPSNPVEILKAIAQPGDFVVFKLDIDTFSIEHAIVDALLADATVLGLIDEFFFEDHVEFAEMLPYWGQSAAKGTSLASSYATFHQLRSKGLRAHSWV